MTKKYIRMSRRALESLLNLARQNRGNRQTPEPEPEPEPVKPAPEPEPKMTARGREILKAWEDKYGKA